LQIVGIALGVLIGLALGLLGGGGSILTVPIFVYVLGFGPKDAIAMSLAVVGATSAVGVAGHSRAGHVNWHVGLLFGAVAMLGTYFGTRLAALMSGAAQLALFAAVMLVAAMVMFRKANRDVVRADAPPHRPLGRVVLQGVAVGMLTGLVGVGGGFLIVPALVLLALPMREAVGTSLLVIAMNCAIGFYGYLGLVHITWPSVVLLIAGTAPGIALGTYLIRFVSPDALRKGFAVFLVVIATYILYQNLATVLAAAS
jgi:uncharacterized membrane protein YfcA